MDRATEGLREMKPKLRKKLIRGLFLTVIGATLFFGYESLIGSLLRSQLVIDSPPNEFTKMWTKVPFPIGFEVYLFHLENPRQFANGAKAKVKEMGPYNYNLEINHEIISFNSDKTRVKFWEINSFEFLPDNSAGRLTDKITTINFPVYALGNMVRELLAKMPLSFAISPVAFGFVNLLFGTHGEGLIKKTTAGELLNGYKFGILETIDTLTRPLSMFGIKMPDTGMPENKFGFLWTKNYTRAGPFESYTGQKNTKTLNIYAFKGERELTYYSEPSCNSLSGTEGTLLEPIPSPNKVYSIFTGATCRTIDLVFSESSTFNAIPAYRFIIDPLTFSSPNKNSKNKCFCYEDDEDWCDGTFDISRCLDGAPIAYSFPHFLGGGNKVVNNVIGMKPDPDVHASFFDIEKHMGSPLRGFEKLQMNGILRPIPYLVGFRSFRKSYFPLLWMKKSAALTEEFTSKTRMIIYPLYVFYYISLGLLLLGIVMLTSAGRSIYKNRGQAPSNLNEVEQISTSSTKSLKPSFNLSSFGQSNNSNSNSNNNLIQDKQAEPNYSYPRLDPETPCLIHRRPSNSNSNNNKAYNSNLNERSSCATPEYNTLAAIQIDKPQPPSRNRRPNHSMTKNFEIPTENPNLFTNSEHNPGELSPSSKVPSDGDRIYLCSPSPGGDDISVSELQTLEVDDFDHGWTSINDSVNNQANFETEVDNTSVPEVDDGPQPAKRKPQDNRTNGASWSPPGSISTVS